MILLPSVYRATGITTASVLRVSKQKSWSLTANCGKVSKLATVRLDVTFSGSMVLQRSPSLNLDAEDIDDLDHLQVEDILAE